MSTESQLTTSATSTHIISELKEPLETKERKTSILSQNPNQRQSSISLSQRPLTEETFEFFLYRLSAMKLNQSAINPDSLKKSFQLALKWLCFPALKIEEANDLIEEMQPLVSKFSLKQQYQFYLAVGDCYCQKEEVFLKAPIYYKYCLKLASDEKSISYAKLRLNQALAVKTLCIVRSQLQLQNKTLLDIMAVDEAKTDIVCAAKKTKQIKIAAEYIYSHFERTAPYVDILQQSPFVEQIQKFYQDYKTWLDAYCKLADKLLGLAQRTNLQDFIKQLNWLLFIAKNCKKHKQNVSHFINLMRQYNKRLNEQFPETKRTVNEQKVIAEIEREADAIIDKTDFPSHPMPSRFEEKKPDSSAFRHYVQGLFKTGEALCGKPPCAYVVLSLGSLNRDNFSWTSDLDVAIMVEKYDETVESYFSNLLAFIKVQLDSSTHYHSLDESQFNEEGYQKCCYTLSELQEQLKKDEFGPFQYSLIRSRCLYTPDISGQKLYQIFYTTIRQQYGLEEKATISASRRPLFQYNLTKHRKEWQKEQTGSHIKKRYLAPLTYLCTNLALFFGLTDQEGLLQNPIAILDRLKDMHCITPILAEKLQKAFTTLCQRRLEIQADWIKKIEQQAVLEPSISESDELPQISSELQQLDVFLKKLYQTAIHAFVFSPPQTIPPQDAFDPTRHQFTWLMSIYHDDLHSSVQLKSAVFFLAGVLAQKLPAMLVNYSHHLMPEQKIPDKKDAEGKAQGIYLYCSDTDSRQVHALIIHGNKTEEILNLSYLAQKSKAPVKKALDELPWAKQEEKYRLPSVLVTLITSNWKPYLQIEEAFHCYRFSVEETRELFGYFVSHIMSEEKTSPNVYQQILDPFVKKTIEEFSRYLGEHKHTSDLSYYHQVPEKHRAFYLRQLKKNTAISRPVLDYLAEYPNRDGSRVIFAEQKKEWEALLHSLTTEVKTQVRLVWFDSQGRHERSLKPAIQNQLFTPSGDPQAKRQSELPGKRLVIPIVIDGKPIAYVKFRPEAPTIQYQVDSLTRRIAGYAMQSTLCRVKTPVGDFPALISQAVPLRLIEDKESQISVIGEEAPTFQTVLKNLDKRSFSLLFLATLMINPEDHQLPNFALEQKPAGYRFVCVDGDHAFDDALVRDGFSLKVNLKSELYCLEQMLETR